MTTTTHNPQVDSQGTGVPPGQAGVVRPSVALRRLLAEQFSADTLRQLAGLMEAQTPGMLARRRLSGASLDELAVMLTSARRPTIGWWRRHA